MGVMIRAVAAAAGLALAMAWGCNGGSGNPPDDPTGNGTSGNGYGNGDLPEMPEGGTRPDIGASPKPPQDALAFYAPDRLHSPLSPAVVRHLREIAAAGPGKNDVFAKVGDSHSVGVMFLECFAQFVEQGHSLGDHAHLRSTLDFFMRGDAAGTSPFERESLATRSGMSARGVIKGDPPLLEQEIDAVRPRFAIVMFGTNDSGFRSLQDFAEDMMRMVDTLADWGVIPLLSTIPPHGDPERRDGVQRFNGMIRAVAAVRNLPLVDLHDALLDLPNMGLRDDDVHLSVDWNQGGGQAACRMDDGGLEFGANVRNLVTLEQLDRVSHAVLGDVALDSEPPALAGGGRATDPLRIPALPFTDGRLLRRGELHDAADLPSPCDGTASGLAGFVYEVSVDEPKSLHAVLHSRFGIRGVVEIHSDGRCVTQDSGEAVRRVPAGRHQVVVRITDDANDDPRAEYLLAVLGL